MHPRFRSALIAFGLVVFTAATVSAQSAPPPAAAPAGPLKLAFVDSRIIVERAPGRAAAESTFQKEYEAAQVKIKKMQDTLSAMMSAYQKTQTTLTAVNRELREKEIREKQQSFETQANLLDAQMQQRQAELVQPIMVHIREILELIQKEESYSFILDVGAANSVIVAADKTLDITEKVIGRLKPVPVSARTRADSTKAQPLGARPQPSGVIKKPSTP